MMEAVQRKDMLESIGRIEGFTGESQVIDKLIEVYNDCSYPGGYVQLWHDYTNHVRKTSDEFLAGGCNVDDYLATMRIPEQVSPRELGDYRLNKLAFTMGDIVRDTFAKCLQIDTRESGLRDLLEDPVRELIHLVCDDEDGEFSLDYLLGVSEARVFSAGGEVPEALKRDYAMLRKDLVQKRGGP